MSSNGAGRSLKRSAVQRVWMFGSGRLQLFRLPRIRLGIGECERRSIRALALDVPEAIVRIAKGLGWACDARIVLGAGAIWLLASRPGTRGTSLRYLAVFATTTALHHAIKRFVDQQRPDHVIQTCGKHELVGGASDAFPSGHAMHAGALASFLASSETSSQPWLWSGFGALAMTRVIALAHWPSGVAAGFAAGVVVERLWRRVRPLG